MLGVALFATRLLLGLIRLHRWRADGVPVDSEPWRSMVQRLSQRLQLPRQVPLCLSQHTTVPAVMGVLRPVILLPASMLSGFTAAEVESILAHELAHIRRHDYLVHLLQSLVETLFFYHPAVWWISQQIRVEREHCCDDLAVAVCGDPLVLANALSRLEDHRNRTELAIAASGGTLLHRIRRITGVEPVAAAVSWPAGAMVAVLLASISCSLWGSATGSGLSWMRSNGVGNVQETGSPAGIQQDAVIVTSKRETTKRDARTGIQQQVFDGIRLAVDHAGVSRQAVLDMKYSNVLAYSLIPARIAAELQAKELGVIDFGKARNGRDGDLIRVMPDGESPAVSPPGLTVSELSQPVAAGQQVVPYPDEVVWLPGHLGTYGLNGTRQHRFRVVRIDKVALGVGPAIGPIQALVLEDANSEFGLIGRDWLQQVRGDHGEALVFSAADSTLVFTRPPETSPSLQKSGDGQRQSPPSLLLPQPGVTVRSTNRPDAEQVRASRLDHDEVTMLATHTYERSTRQSQAWVQWRGARVPVDVGVRHEDIEVYLTLMMDLVAVNVESGDTLWGVDWRKGMPFWQTLSIVELHRGENRQRAVELFANDSAGKPVYQYLSLTDGTPVSGPQGERRPPPLVAKPDGAWGDLAEVSGLRSRLTLQQPTTRLDQPIVCMLEVRNFGDQPAQVDPQRYAAFRVLRVQGADGASARFIGMTPQTDGNPVTLAPGESMTLWQDVDVHSLFLLNQGAYRLFAEGGEWAMQTIWRDSNSLSINIAEGQPGPLHRLMTQLLDRLPEDWELSSGASLGPDWQAVFMSHAPSHLKRDITSIQIWFTEEKLADDFELGQGDQKQTVTQLGRCELGYFNMAASPGALEIWPVYETQVREAAQQSLNFSDRD